MNKASWWQWYTEIYLHTDHWHEVQQVVYARNKGNCERCNTNRMEHVHHYHYYSLWHELEDPARSSAFVPSAIPFCTVAAPMTRRRKCRTRSRSRRS